MVGVAAVVAEKLRGVTAAVDRNADRSVVEEIGGCKAASCDRVNEVWSERIGDLFEVASAQVMKHEQRFFVGDFAVIEVHVVYHGSVGLQDIRPAVVVVVNKLCSDST